MNETTRKSPIPKETKLQWWTNAGMVGAVVIAAGIAVETGQVASGNSVRVVASDLLNHIELSEAKDARQDEKITEIRDDIEDIKDSAQQLQIDGARREQKIDDQSNTIREIRDILREDRRHEHPN